jgi:hypothetical protein
LSTKKRFGNLTIKGKHWQVRGKSEGILDATSSELQQPHTVPAGLLVKKLKHSESTNIT